VTSRTRRILFHLGSFILAGGLLFLALYGVDLGAMVDAFKKADWRWLAPLVALVLGANLCRAWRWQVLIDALPTTPDFDALDEKNGAPKNSLEASFTSIMIGYMVNYVAPRLGEIARTANMAARSSFRFSSLLGTVVSERIFDTAVLGLALLTAFGLLMDRFSVLQKRLLEPAWTNLTSLPLYGILGTGAGVVALAFVVYALIRHGMEDETSVLHRFWAETVRPAIVSFKDGMMTLVRSPSRGAILVSTVAMWSGYLLMAYIPFRMLDLAAPYGIGLIDAWILMAIGALGLLVPSPGGIGSYHYITKVALVHLYGVPEAQAVTYAVLTHAAQFVFYILTGGIAVLYQGTGLRSLYPPDRSEAKTVDDPAH